MTAQEANEIMAFEGGRVIEHEHDLPKFPQCTVLGHDHELRYISTSVQAESLNKGYVLQCPFGTYRFFFIPKVWEDLHRMAREQRPRYGWKTERLSYPDYSMIKPGVQYDRENLTESQQQEEDERREFDEMELTTIEMSQKYIKHVQTRKHLSWY